MKRYRDPTPALTPSEPDLPMREKVLCAIVVTILVIGAVWVSVHLGHPR